MSKILITGGAGFLGFSLAKALSEDPANRLTLVDNLHYNQHDPGFSKFIESGNVKFLCDDLTDHEITERLDHDFDMIYHFAAIKFNLRDPGLSDRILYVNALSTLNMLELARKTINLRRFVFSSTGEVYAGTQHHYGIPIPTGEVVNLVLDDLYAPRTSYPLTKIFGEAACIAYGKKFNIPFTVFRYHNLYGPRMGFFGVIPDTFVKIRKNSVVEVYAPDHSRDFTYIDDAVQMTILVCREDRTQNKVFNIGNPAGEITIRKLVETIAKVMGRKITIVGKPDLSGAPSRRCADISKIRKFITPEYRVPLEKGLYLTYDWYKNHPGSVTED
jgi:nucleoside-diphosphate-sugar epimerase